MVRVLQLLLEAQQGLIVVGEQVDPASAAAAVQLGGALGWPVAADVLSGCGLAAAAAAAAATAAVPAARWCCTTWTTSCWLVTHLVGLIRGGVSCSQMLCCRWGSGVTSKRVNQFMVSFTGERSVC